MKFEDDKRGSRGKFKIKGCLKTDTVRLSCLDHTFKLL